MTKLNSKMAKSKEMFINELSDNMLVCSNNYNIMTHLYKTIHLCSYKSGLLKNIHIQKHKSNKKDRIDTTYIDNPEIFYKLSHEGESQYVDIFQFFYNRKYYDKVNINDKVYCILLFGEINKIKQNSIEHNVRFNNRSLYQSFKVIKSYNVSNNFNPLYDIFVVKNKTYIMKLTLNTIYYSIIQDDKYKDSFLDKIIMLFITDVESFLKNLTHNKLEKREQIIYGGYDIEIRELYGPIPTLKYETRVSTFDSLIKTRFYKSLYDYKKSYKYIFNLFQFENIFKRCKTIKLNDDELIQLFNDKPKKKKSIKNKEPEPEPEPEPETEPEPEPDYILRNINIQFYHKHIQNREYITEILYEIVNTKLLMREMYDEYDNIMVYKDIIKDYTNKKYINFYFYNSNKRTNAYHAYLDDGKLSNITYIAQI